MTTAMITAFSLNLPVSPSNRSSRFVLNNVTRARPCTPAKKSFNPIRMQVWSDPACTEEYFDYLEGRDQIDPTTDCQSTIVGKGRIGSFLAKHGQNDLIIERGQEIPPDAPGPVYVCTRSDDLGDIITSCPPEKKDDLVFVQNGMMEKYLRSFNVDENTRCNLYFAIPKLGAKPIDGITYTDPEGLTAVCGKWQDAFAERLERVGLTCKIYKERDFRRSQLEKLIWICAFNLIGSVHGGITMGEVAKMHVNEVTEMSRELATMIRFTLTVGMLPNIEDRLMAYATRVKDFPTGLKEFRWRNGFFMEYSKLAMRNGLSDPTPMHRYVYSFILSFFSSLRSPCHLHTNFFFNSARPCLHSGYLQDGKDMGIIEW